MSISRGPGAPELIFALVSPVGAPSAAAVSALDGALHTYGYRARRIKLSERLKDAAERSGTTLVDAPEHERVQAYMDFGDKLCSDAGTASEVVRLGIEEMQGLRLRCADPALDPSDTSVTPLERWAWIIDSLKRPAEVTALREIYGDHLVVLALQASKPSRTRALTEKIRPEVASLREPALTAAAAKLLERDFADPEQGAFGQNIVKTFPLADVFIDAAEDPGIGPQIERFIDLLFGNPAHSSPTQNEHGMQLAYVASTMSPELGLKVGAAIMADGSVISLGSNAHPTSVQQSPAFDRSKVEIERLVLDTATRFAEAGVMSDDARTSLYEKPDEWVHNLLKTDLKGSAITALTEFQPTVHAEMAALLEAVEQGRGVKGAHIFVTAYPCHGCAKHLLRVGLSVTYLEPYPKSLAEAMYGQEVSGFEPFTGIAPRRYNQLFATTEDRKGPDGARIAWSPVDKAKAMPIVEPHIDHAGIVSRESLFVNGLKDIDAETLDTDS